MQCQCHQQMHILLRTIIYAQKVTVHYVPVYTCHECNRTEVHPKVKHHLSSLIRQLGSSPMKQTIYFQDENEFAKLLFRASSEDYLDSSVDDIIELRVNELLELLMIAESMNDRIWVTEIHDRLDQISDYSRTINEWN